MAIELISEIVQKNNGKFPLLDSNNLRGGFYSVTTEENMNSIPTERRKVGMLCYITSINKYFKLNSDGTWGKANLGGSGIIQVNTKEDISSLEDIEPGQIVFVRDTNEFWYLRQDNTWGAFNSIVVSETEPSKEVLWIDPTGDSNINQEGNLINIRQSIQTLQQQMEQVIKIVQYGAIAGDSTLGGRTLMMASAAPINPNKDTDSDSGNTDGGGTDSSGTAEVQIEPDHLKYTIPNISIKVDTASNFAANKRNLIDGELIWIKDKQSLYIYINGKFIAIASGGGGDIPVTPDDDMTQEDIEKLYFNNLGFVDSKSNQYTMKVNDQGNIIVYNASNYDGNIGDKGKYGSYISDLLRINSIFLGGVNTKLDSFSACSHNYVELANASTKDINLNGIYLLYRAPGVDEWTPLALYGTIKAGSTFLIRGARCSYKSNVTLDVDSYDMLWYKDNNLIQFDNGGGCFYLVCSDGGQFYKGTDKVSLANLSGYEPYSATEVPTGYIDFVGIKTPKTTQTIPSEGNSPITLNSTEDPKDCIFVRSFPIDPCSQSQKTQDKKKSSALWTYINMSTKGTDAFPYYSEKDKHLFIPKGSALSKNIFDVRSTFSEDKPNMFNITFGIQATDAGNGATRCFNWVSVGYYDEYIEYKKESEDWNAAKKVDSILKGNTYSDSNIVKFIDIYTRIKWVTTNGTSVTTHKAIVRGLTAGTYSVRVRRHDDDSYVGDTVHFTVRTDTEVNKGFTYAQTTDQQGFNYYEYKAWAKAAYILHQKHPDIQFTINTGDMTQNGNRENEWLDYYNGRKYLANIEDMVTIGNNDLCGKIPYMLGDGSATVYKINHKNIQYYYCFELSETNAPIFTFKYAGKLDTSLLGDVLSYDTEANTFTYYMPSIYSFNYGKYHFICLNSEFTATTYQCYYEDATIGNSFKEHAFYNMYVWLTKDYDKTRNNVAYMHELPICIVVGDSTTGVAKKRTMDNGSKLNQELSDGAAYTPNAPIAASTVKGGCNFSEFFQTHNIKLCMGGHKHTYSLSYPTKENITTTDGNRTVDYANPIVDKTGDNGVTYAMCQATGYKLVSNKELPGSGIAWIRKYFPMSNGKGSASQYYPMYSVYQVSSSAISMQSYTVYNIYGVNGTKVTNFNINSQYPEFTTKNEVAIEDTNVTITY